jgi:cytochrome c-type biogenesis protein CcmH
VQGTVKLSPTLAARVAAGDTVFIFARAAQGPRMPLAIIRQKAGNLPLSFTLDDSQSMSPDAKLSGFSDVVISARISKDGSATPRSGDLQGSRPVKVGARDVEILVDSVVP